LKRLSWPSARYRIVVVADNCTDATASISREAGATVLERQDLTRRGKGYALAHAFTWSRSAGIADAVAVVDADSVVSANLLESFATRIEAGACALQAHYGVLNATDSWRTRLMAIALGSYHKLRSRARERLGLSCGIRGNGWCVTHALLDKIPYRSFSLTEDVEFGVDLGLAGYRVAYCDESHVDGEMVTSEHAARSQRQRWEGGRIRLIREKVPALLRAAVARRSLVCLDLALDLLVLPLSYVVVNVVGIIAIAALNPDGFRSVLLTVGLIDLLALALYVCRGWMLSGIGIVGLLDLMRVPVFLLWKLRIIRDQPKPNTWIRTRRER
jgi:cellulose synthase/poly-beta-1,6-N-acetylglucosamine synthase-like glycosyltransferase